MKGMTMNDTISTTLPKLVVEYQRYVAAADETGQTPDGWVFYHLTPSDYVHGDETPFDYEFPPVELDDAEWEKQYEAMRWYKGRVEGWGEKVWADKHRRDNLVFADYRQIQWPDIPVIVRRYIASRVTPVGWFDGLNEGEAEVTGLVSIWIKGEWPVTERDQS